VNYEKKQNGVPFYETPCRSTTYGLTTIRRQTYVYDGRTNTS